MFVVPDDYDRFYTASPHLERLRQRDEVRVYEDALYEALAARRIAGAGLDVFGEEPLPPGHRWAALDIVVLTSHRGWTTHETLDRFMGAAVNNALAWLDGKPRNMVNPQVLSGSASRRAAELPQARAPRGER